MSGQLAPSIDPKHPAPRRGWLTVATEWASRRGGISTFNRRLCCALAAEGEQVVCLVPDATADEQSEARKAGVELVTAPPEPGVDEASRLRRRPTLPEGFTPTVVIGHGRITGPAARALVDDHYTTARRLHLLHMAPDEIEWHKPGRDDDAATRAEDRSRQEVELGRSSYRAIAIGPRLYNHFARELRDKVVRLDPGVDASPLPAGPPPGQPHVVLAFGRMEDPEIKRPDLAAQAAAKAREYGRRLELYVRGARPGSSDAQRAWLIEKAGDPGLPVVVRPYTTDVERLDEDLRRASLVLMPSRTEGFGLVGLEAIAAGVPVRISDQSGLGELLCELLAAEAARHVVPITQDDVKDVAAWGRAINLVLSERETAFRRAAELREALAGRLTWAKAVQVLIAAVEAE